MRRDRDRVSAVLTRESNLETTPEVKYSAMLSTKLHAPAASTLLIPHNPTVVGGRSEMRRRAFLCVLRSFCPFP